MNIPLLLRRITSSGPPDGQDRAGFDFRGHPIWDRGHCPKTSGASELSRVEHGLRAYAGVTTEGRGFRERGKGDVRIWQRPLLRVEPLDAVPRGCRGQRR